MNRKALGLIGHALDSRLCATSDYEDYAVGACLYKLGTVVGDSVDQFGRERFHPLSIEHYFDNATFPYWMQRFAGNKTANMGFQALSATSISFHYMFPDKMKRIDRLWKEYKASSNKSKSFNESVIIRFLQEQQAQ